jgi:hypothetical protein
MAQISGTPQDTVIRVPHGMLIAKVKVQYANLAAPFKSHFSLSLAYNDADKRFAFNLASGCRNRL